MSRRLNAAERRIESMKVNYVDPAEIYELAYPRRPSHISNHKKNYDLIKMLCSCGGYASQYGKQHPWPIWHPEGYECPHCHQITENVGEISNWHYQEDNRLVTVFENHDGCDFIRYFWVRVGWAKGWGNWFDVFEAWRYTFDEEGRMYVMRRQFRGPEYDWSMVPDDPLRIINNSQCRLDRLRQSTYAAIGELSPRFMKAHVEIPEIAVSSWIIQWLCEVTDPNFDPHMETLLVKRQFDAFFYFLSRHGEAEFWPQVKMAMRRDYEMTEMWFDELHNLQELGLSLTDPKNLFPINLKAQHEAHNDIIDRRTQQQILKAKIQSALNKLPEYEKKYAKTMEEKIMRYANVVITAPGLVLTPLKTIREFAEEGTALSHCLYTSEYFAVKDYLVMSARDEMGNRLETVTVSIHQQKIVACLGAHNKFSTYHKRIQYVVEKAMGHILAGKWFELKEFPEEVIKSEFTAKDVLAAQNCLPSIFNWREEEDKFDDIRFKKACQDDGNEVVLALKVYADTDEKFLFADPKRDSSSAFKITKARVIGIYGVDGKLTDMKKAKSIHDETYYYEVGEDCKPMNEGEDGSGIYCFNTFGGAKDYWFGMNIKFQRAAS